MRVVNQAEARNAPISPIPTIWTFSAWQDSRVVSQPSYLRSSIVWVK